MNTIEVQHGKLVLDSFLDHVGANRVSTDLAASNFLKHRHNKYHVTAVKLETADLFRYADAGHACCTLVKNVKHEFETSYEAPEYRLNAVTEVGKLNDRITFGFYSYEWSGTTYLVYRFEVPHFLRGSEKFTYVLAPLDEGEPDKGHSPVTDKLLLAVGHWTSQLHEEIYVFDAGNWTKNKSLYKSVHSSSWDDVVLNADMKRLLMKDIMGFFDSREIYQRFQVSWKRGIILHGLPGNGKTISLKAVMSSLASRDPPIPSLYVKTFEGCNPGASQQYSIRTIFNKARKTAPCLLIFEDLDSLITDKTRSYFLNEVDGIEANDGILMIGSTNYLSKLDPAIRDRPSRFDRKYFFKIPEIAERANYARYWKSKLTSTDEVDLPEEACEFIAQLTDGFSFAYMKELFVAALLVVARGGTAEDAVDSARVAGGIASSAPPGTEADSQSFSSTSAQDTPTSSTAENDADTKPLDNAAKATAKGEDDARRAVNTTRKAAISALKLPEELQENVFVRVIQQQALVLLDEMGGNSETKKIVVPSEGDPMLRGYVSAR